MPLGDDLLALQAIDSEVDHLNRRIETPPELAPYDEARRAVADTRAALAAAAEQRTALEAELGQAETTTAEIDRQVQRLQHQLRNVVVVREAEALQHELVTLAQRRSDLDDVGLVALEQLDALDAQQAELEQRLPEQQHHLTAATEALEAARAELTQRRDERVAQRSDVSARVPAPVLTRYDALRQRLGGIGAAALEGARCTGCRLDLARSELEELRAAPADELVDCPNCGRLLVR